MGLKIESGQTCFQRPIRLVFPKGITIDGSLPIHFSIFDVPNTAERRNSF